MLSSSPVYLFLPIGYKLWEDRVFFLSTVIFPAPRTVPGTSELRDKRFLNEQKKVLENSEQRREWHGRWQRTVREAEF